MVVLYFLGVSVDTCALYLYKQKEKPVLFNQNTCWRENFSLYANSFKYSFNIAMYFCTLQLHLVCSLFFVAKYIQMETSKTN